MNFLYRRIFLWRIANQITIIDEDGNEELCEILFTFESEEFGKSYVLYYPISAEEDEDGEIEIHALVLNQRRSR